MADWHDTHQNPYTGFWHRGDAKDKGTLLNALAGAAHNLHIYYYLTRDVPRAEQIVDSCLRLGYMGIHSACVDLDIIDILVNLRQYGHRVKEIDSVLERYLVELLQVQNADGGFSDNYVSSNNTYGLITPAGMSVTWATWFRLLAIGMIAFVFLSEERTKWRFRNTLGMGYFNPDNVLGNFAGTESSNPVYISPVLELQLRISRRIRFARKTVRRLSQFGSHKLRNIFS